MKKRVYWGALISALLVLGTTISAQAQKFGYVNSDAVLAAMPQVKQAEANLDALQKQLQKKGQNMVEELQQDYMKIQQQIEQGELSPKQQEEEAKKLEDRQKEIADFEQDMMSQVQEKRQELLEPILENVNQAIQDVAKEEGFQFVFDSTILLYAEDSQNLTNKVKAKLGLEN